MNPSLIFFSMSTRQWQLSGPYAGGFWQYLCC